MQMEKRPIAENSIMSMPIINDANDIPSHEDEPEEYANAVRENEVLPVLISHFLKTDKTT